MMMTRKKKLKISKMLAAMIYIVENEPNISPESFSKLVGNCFDIAFEVGDFSMMSSTMKLVKELRNTRTQKEG